MNTSIENYFVNGCMRCKYGATPQCKVNKWMHELQLLRNIAHQSLLTEEVKWGVPVYTFNGKNIFSINALKDSANISFFKGVLIKDNYKILQQQDENVQSERIIKYTDTETILSQQEILHDYIQQAIEIEKNGTKVVFNKKPEPIPAELATIFDTDIDYKNAFFNLTQGRQRGYILHFSQPKKEETRIERIQKMRNQILQGIGFHDAYKSK